MYCAGKSDTKIQKFFDPWKKSLKFNSYNDINSKKRSRRNYCHKSEWKNLKREQSNKMTRINTSMTYLWPKQLMLILQKKRQLKSKVWTPRSSRRPVAPVLVGEVRVEAVQHPALCGHPVGQAVDQRLDVAQPRLDAPVDAEQVAQHPELEARVAEFVHLKLK